MIKAIMHGCNGKMGQVITNICKEDSGIEIVAGIDVYDGIANDYPVFPNISVCNVSADVIIDFSTASAIDDLLVYSVEKQIPVVLLYRRISPVYVNHIGENLECVERNADGQYDLRHGDLYAGKQI